MRKGTVIIDAIVRTLKIHRFKAGEIVHVLPGHLHRIEALEDITLMETSTTELDDVVRLQDDAQRPDGRIAEEHK